MAPTNPSLFVLIIEITIPSWVYLPNHLQITAIRYLKALIQSQTQGIGLILHNWCPTYLCKCQM